MYHKGFHFPLFENTYLCQSFCQCWALGTTCNCIACEYQVMSGKKKLWPRCSHCEIINHHCSGDTIYIMLTFHRNGNTQLVTGTSNIWNIHYKAVLEIKSAVSCMNKHESFQTSCMSGWLFLADFTFIGTISSMNKSVSFQISNVVKWLLADFIFMRMNSCMNKHVCFQISRRSPVWISMCLFKLPTSFKLFQHKTSCRLHIQEDVLMYG